MISENDQLFRNKCDSTQPIFVLKKNAKKRIFLSNKKFQFEKLMICYLTIILKNRIESGILKLRQVKIKLFLLKIQSFGKDFR